LLFAERFQVLEGGEPGALGDFVVAADTLNGAGGGTVGEVDRAERVGGVAGHFGERLVGDGRFEAHVAAAEPVGVDQSVDEEQLVRAGGTVLKVVVAGERFKLFGVLAGDDGKLGVGAVAESVHAGGGLSLFGARTGGFHRVQAIGRNLSGSCHTAGRYHAVRPRPPTRNW
jgi:hypothetical protein